MSDTDSIKTKNRLTYIDPNTFASYFNASGNKHLRMEGINWNPEDLAMSVDLQVIIPRRSDKGRENYLIQANNVVMRNTGKTPIGRYVSYMGGMPLNQKENSESYLTDNYTNISFQEVVGGKIIDKESLGLDSIDINFDAHFFPIVTIKFTDVRGSSLFMPSEQEFDASLRGESAPHSFFKALFHFPYPRFLLSVKGFYGNRVTFQLAVSDFTSAFQSDTGNYDVTVKFIGYVYGLYTDLPLNLVMASPYYNNTYWQEQKSNGTFRYMSKDGGVGGEMKTYVEFLTKLDGRDVTSEHLNNTEFISQYHSNNSKKSLLEEIKELHRRMLSDEPNNSTLKLGTNNVCVFGSGDNGIFIFGSEELANEYLSKISRLSEISSDDEFDSFMSGNALVENFKKKGYTFPPLKSEISKVIDGFQKIEGVAMTSYFTIEDGKIKDILSSEISGDSGLNKYFIDNRTIQGYTSNYKCVVLDKNKYLSNLDEICKNIEKDVENSISDVSTELVSVFENVIGFAPTVENFYRMLFAHIDCFFNYFNVKILGDITTQTNKKQRRVKYFTDAGNFDISEIDIPKTLTGGSDATTEELDVYPFPGYYIEKPVDGITRLTAEYPGKSPNSRFRKIREVDGVEKMLDGVMKLKETINQIDSNFNSNETGDFEDNTFSILSPLYNCENPWKDFTFTFENNEDEIDKIIYFYMCLLVADKAVGTNVGSRLDENNENDENAYHNRVAKMLATKLTSAPTGFTKALEDMIDYFQGNASLEILNNRLKQKYKLNAFSVPTGNSNIMLINKEVNNNYLPLKVVYSKLNANIKDIQDKNELFPVNLNDEKGSSNKYFGITGVNSDSDKGILNILNKFDEERCKTYHIKLEKFKVIDDYNEANKYLANIRKRDSLYKGKIPYGTCCVSYPKVDTENTPNITYKKIRGSTDVYTLKGAIYNVDLLPEETEKGRKFYRNVPAYDSPRDTLPIGRTHQSSSPGYKPTIIEATTDLYNFYYNGGVPNYKVNFVGYKSNDFLRYGDEFYEIFPASNLFSGVKKLIQYYASGDEYRNEPAATTKTGGYNIKFDEIKIVINGKVQEDVFSNEVSLDMLKKCRRTENSNSIYLAEKKDGSYELQSKYLPLRYTDYCNPVSGTPFSETFTETDRKYAIATYLCAILSGYERLKFITQRCAYTKFADPVRLVELLYLGGVCYFYEKRYGEEPTNVDEHGEHYIMYELIKDTGEIALGLVRDNKEEQKDRAVDIRGVFTNKNIRKMLIEKFKNWCNNELFGGKNMYEQLCKIDSDTKNDLLGCCGDKFTRELIVQGYGIGSPCEQWLTNLTYSYAQIVTFTYGTKVAEEYGTKKIGRDLTIYRRDIRKFLKSLRNLIGTSETNDGSQSPTNDATITNSESVDARLALYYTLKNLYDKWLCTYTAQEFKLKTPQQDINMRKNRYCGVNLDKDKNGEVNRNNLVEKCSEYNNFVYVDQFYNDISFDYIMDADYIGELIRDINRGGMNCDVYSFMSMMAEKNNLMLIALPVFNNMYNASSIASVFSPNTFYNANNYDGYNGIGTTYVVMYTSDVSHQPSLYDKYDYNRDYLDIADVVGNTGPEDLKFFSSPSSGSNRLNYDVSAFAVTYGAQNQMYFKKVNVSMDSPKVTDESIRNVLMISEAGSQGPTEQPSAIGQNIYSIYSNRSYTCTVEMLGCANITPMMYFQLNNIPMFRGLYMIINVKHTIKAGDMTTIFTGIRVSRYSLPKINDILMHSCIFRRIMSADSSSNSSSGGGSSIQENNSPVDTHYVPTSGEDLNCHYPGIQMSSNELVNMYKKDSSKNLGKNPGKTKKFIAKAIQLGWPKAVICAMCGILGNESDFNTKSVNKGTFIGHREGTKGYTPADASANKPWFYACGLIQWCQDRKVKSVAKYLNISESSAIEFLTNGVPLYNSRTSQKYRSTRMLSNLVGKDDWDGGIENQTLEWQMGLIDYEWKNNFKHVGDAIKKITGNTTNDVRNALYIIYVCYVAKGFRNTSVEFCKNKCCEISAEYRRTHGNGEKGIEGRIAWAEAVFDDYDNLRQI